MLSWFYLAGAILFEVAGTTAMRLAEGFTRPLPSVLIFVFYGISFVFLTYAVRRIDLSVAYAVWSGVGMALIALVGLYVFEEPMTPLKVVSLGLVFVGIAGLSAGDVYH